jgi:16S rRNA (guanine527-N7)-methyltransferase
MRRRPAGNALIGAAQVQKRRSVTPLPQGASVEEEPDCAGTAFGARLPLARRYAELLVRHAVPRGLVGPQESGRIWSRHLLNCAALAAVVPEAVAVVDVGSGAGLPGLALAIARPDVAVRLVEPQARRIAFLAETVATLGLAAQVRIVRGRAEEPTVVAAAGNAEVVTARAVAPLDRLVRWCLPLLAPAGQLALIRGTAAERELTEHEIAIRHAGGNHAHVIRCGYGGDIQVPIVIVRRRAGDGNDRGHRSQAHRG